MLCVALFTTGASKCQSDSDDSSSGSNSTPRVSAAANPTEARCESYRKIFEASKPTKKERKLDAAAGLLSSYRRMHTYYAKFAQIFPESATAANALSSIYGQASKGSVAPAEKAKIGGLEDKVERVVDANCPNG